jgi:hypothetical protein
MKRLLAYLFIVFGLGLTFNVNVEAKGDLEGFLQALDKAKKIGLTIDADTTAKQFGYKNFDDFFKDLKKNYDLEDLTIDEAKEYLTGTDKTVEIIESDENLKILHKLILKDKLLKKYLTTKKEHAKVLAIYFDYEKEMAKISKNPNLDKIGRFAFHWMWHTEKGPDTYYNQYDDAIDGCEENRKKRSIPDGGKCMLIDYRYGDEFRILLKPILKDKQNKKVVVAKVEEPKQEEFKPVNKDVDNQAPIIDIADSVTVNNQTFTLKGKVTDKSKLYIQANNRPLTVAKNGEFKLEGFVVDPEAGEQIKLVAIDQWQNKSEKIIKINVEFKDVAELRSYADPNPNKIKVKEDKNKIAIIIGIEKYRFLKNIDAPYANRDANAFRAYANRALGIPNKNIKILIDENATRGETLKALTLWLPQAAKGKNKDIYIFFAGHGLASDDGKNLYILPQDGEAALLQYTAISRLEMFELINKVEPNSVTMFFDTCYSGQTRDEEMLVAGLRPIRLTAEEQDTPNNFTIFTASNYDQTSGSINQAKHGIFSYYLMKGMEGQADSNQDKKITNGELIAYLKQNVSEEAFINNRQQEPMLSGDPDKVLISYN